MGFPDALIVSDLIRGKTGQRKPVFWHILRSSTTFFKKALIWRIAFAQTNPNAFSLCQQSSVYSDLHRKGKVD